MRIGVVFQQADIDASVAACIEAVRGRGIDVASIALDGLPDEAPAPQREARVADHASLDLVALVVGPALEAAFDVRAPATGWNGLLRSIARLQVALRGIEDSRVEVVLVVLGGAAVPAGVYPGVPWAPDFGSRRYDAATPEALERLPEFLASLARSGSRRPLPPPASPPAPRPAAADATHLRPQQHQQSQEAADDPSQDDSSQDDPPTVAVWRPRTPTPVRLALAAPATFTPARPFPAMLAAYVDAHRRSVARHLAQLGGDDQKRVLGLEPDRQSDWTPGAPVSVRLAAVGADVAPAEIRFEWSGRDNIASFIVSPHADATGDLLLVFQVAIAGVPLSQLPLAVRLADGRQVPAAEAGVQERSLPPSAFASYASADSDAVGQCLSTLAPFVPGLPIFQDCLDLHPGEAFKPQLEGRIRDAASFLLFWSRHAARSTWVRWELETALACAPRLDIVPVPLEDPALAPPPPEFAALHMRDRYLMARYALAAVRAEAGRDAAGS